MPRPAKIAEAIHPNVNSEERIFSPNWADEFGPYDWAYIANFEQVCSALELQDNRTGQLVLNKYSEQAVSNAPPDWAKLFVDPHTNTKGGWGSLSSKQFKKAFNKYPMRLDKAALVILALEAYAAEHKKTVDVWSMVSIRPAIFLVDGLNKQTYDSQIREHVNSKDEFRLEMLTRTFQISVSVLSGLAEGKPVTYQTAQRFIDFLRSRPETRRVSVGPVIQVAERVNVSKKEPCSNEITVHA